MDTAFKGINTLCTHVGELADERYKGAVSPLYMGTAYDFEQVDQKRYPRYFNTPNQEALGKKLAALEHTGAALIFSSGMAAITTALLAVLKAGDHVLLQQTIYGGTYNLATTQFEKFGIEFSFTSGWEVGDFEKGLRPNTKVIYVETPSNPLLTITDLAGVSALAKKKGLLTMIDNTFASPINQNPIDLGIDVVLHSATKYMGGHSDICAGVVAASKDLIDQVLATAICFGGNLSDYTVWLLERSLKTMGIRVLAQNRNAMAMARYLSTNRDVVQVHYPGLESHPGHEIAKAQMHGFGGMLSFELEAGIDASRFFRELRLIKPAMSLAGVESTVLSPTQTSHSLLTPEDREKQGIRDSLIRFSVGLEEPEDLISDIAGAIARVKAKAQGKKN